MIKLCRSLFHKNHLFARNSTLKMHPLAPQNIRSPAEPALPSEDEFYYLHSSQSTLFDHPQQRHEAFTRKPFNKKAKSKHTSSHSSHRPESEQPSTSTSKPAQSLLSNLVLTSPDSLIADLRSIFISPNKAGAIRQYIYRSQTAGTPINNIAQQQSNPNWKAQLLKLLESPGLEDITVSKLDSIILNSGQSASSANKYSMLVSDAQRSPVDEYTDIYNFNINPVLAESSNKILDELEIENDAPKKVATAIPSPASIIQPLTAEESYLSIQETKNQYHKSKNKKLLSRKLSFIDQSYKNQSLQAPNEIALFTRTNMEKLHAEFSQNWVYAYGLPYEVTQEDINDFIDFVERCYGQVESHIVFPYKNIVEKKDIEAIYKLPDNIEPNENFNEAEGISRQEAEAEQVSQKDITSTHKILHKIKQEKNVSFNKSYVLLKFKSSKSKEMILSPDLRIFGTTWHGCRVRFQRAEEKSSIVITEIPWGTSYQDVGNWINDVLTRKGEFKMEITTGEPNKVLIKNYVFVSFNSFWESLRAMKLLSGEKFENQKIKIHHSYGGLKAFRGSYAEILQNKDYDELKERLSQIRENKVKNMS